MLFLLSAACSLLGCQKSPAVDNPPSPASSPNESQPSTPTASVSEEEAELFISEIKHAYATNDSDAFNRLIDWEGMADKATRELGLPKAKQQGAARGLIQGTTINGKFLQALRGNGPEPASYHSIGTQFREGQQHVLFRLNSEAGMNYHDFTLGRVDGSVRATNMYIYLSGESLSETWRRVMLPMAVEENKNWMQKLTTKESEFAKHVKEFHALSQAVRAGNFETALNIYNSLPKSVQNEKVVMLFRLQAASPLGDDEYIRAAQDFRRVHPDEKCLDLLMIDAHYLRGQYEEAIQCINRLDKALGGDPFLNVHRANMLLELGKQDEAIAAARKAVEGAPEEADSYWTLVSVANHSNDHALTLEALRKLENQFEIDWLDLRESPEFTGFVESSEGKAWLRNHGFN